MSNSRYVKGRRNEYKSMKWLEQRGWDCYRTAGSHSKWDILALRPSGGEVLLVQVKTNRKPPIYKADYQHYHPDFRIHLHVWMDGGKDPEVYSFRTGYLVP